jgi:SAM-dependent methyltransferase
MASDAVHDTYQNSNFVARIPGARSFWRFLCALKLAWRDGSEVSCAELEHVYQRPIAFDYISDEADKRRHKCELAMLDRVSVDKPFSRALEIGCAEGIFTESLAKRCQSLLAVDLLEVALARARERLAHADNIEFARLNIRTESIPGQFDLICASHVLEYIRNPLHLRKVRARILRALKPGGYLLVGFWTVDPNEKYWWSQYFLRGGKRLAKFFAAPAELTVVDTWKSDDPERKGYFDLLLRKKM